MKNPSSFIHCLIIMVFVCLLKSCSSVRVNANHRKTDRLIGQLSKKNNNAFALGSTYYNFSTIWSYDNSTINIYKLTNGHIKERKVIKTNEPFVSSILDTSKINEIDDCIELDGDVILIKLKGDFQNEIQILPVNIKCFLSKEKIGNSIVQRIKCDIMLYNLSESFVDY